MKSVNIQGKEYVMVHERLLHLNELTGGEYSIKTKAEFYESQNMWVVFAQLEFRGQVYTGLAQEIVGDGYINKTSALENCETSAVGRALGMAGIGIDTGFASADEVKKARDREAYNKDEASEKQIRYIEQLVETCILGEEHKAKIFHDTYTREEASEIISMLKDNQPESLNELFDRKVK